MKKPLYEKQLGSMFYQRNIFAFLSVVLSICLLIGSSFLFFKKERIIVSPPLLEKSFWVDGNQVSPTYLEQYGLFLGQLLLSKSSYSAPTQRQILLRHTTPDYTGILHKKLIEEENLLKKQNASYIFFPTSTTVIANKLQATITGDRASYIGSKKVSSEREAYTLSFTYTNGRLLLKTIVKQEKKHV